MQRRRYSLLSWNFNPRSPCGERRPRPLSVPMCSLFQSTLPVRGATYMPGLAALHQVISIHAPRAGSDAERALLLVCV